MKTLLSAVAALMMVPAVAFGVPILSNTATQSGGTLIDFEGQTNGANADNLYAGFGVTFNAAVGNTRIWDPAAAGNQVPSSGTGILGPTQAGTDPISFVFASAQSFVEFFFADPNVILGTTYTLTAYDAANAILESFIISANQLPGSYYTGFARAGADIRRVSLDPSNGGENFSVDDLRFGRADVPEPSTIAVLALGLGLLARSRKRSV